MYVFRFILCRFFVSFWTFFVLFDTMGQKYKKLFKRYRFFAFFTHFLWILHCVILVLYCVYTVRRKCESMIYGEVQAITHRLRRGRLCGLGNFSQPIYNVSKASVPSVRCWRRSFSLSTNFSPSLSLRRPLCPRLTPAVWMERMRQSSSWRLKKDMRRCLSRWRWCRNSRRRSCSGGGAVAAETVDERGDFALEPDVKGFDDVHATLLPSESAPQAKAHPHKKIRPL